MTLALVVGEPMAEVLDAPAGAIPTGFGGDALNVAVYLARRSPDLTVALASAVGDDPASDALLVLCREERIDTSHVRRVAGARLGRYGVQVNDAGERSFSYDRSASPYRDALAVGDLLPDPRDVGLLVFSGISLAVARGAGRETLVRFAGQVRAMGALVAYDVNHRPALWADSDAGRSWLRRVAPIAGVVLASVDDGRAMVEGATAARIAAGLAAIGAGEAVVTDGPRPCAVAAEGRVTQVPARVPAIVLDTTAAGDAFDAGYLAERLGGAGPLAAAAAGHRMAARVIAHRGAIAPRS